MLFAFDEDQRALAETARALLVETCTPDSLRSLLTGDTAQDPERLSALREMGLFAVLAPEDAGGLDLKPVDFAAIVEAAGYVALPEPLVEQAGVAVPLLASLADDRGWLARVLEGAAIAVQSPDNAFVLDADTAEVFLLPHGEEIHLVEAAHVTLTRQESIDPLRRLYRVDWTPNDATRVGTGWAEARDLGALWSAGQLIGLAQRAIDLAVDYAKDRTQFGRAIGSYQAVKHLIASAQVKVEFARPVYHAAAAEIGSGLAGSARVSHAKLAAIQASELAMRTSLQVHGAIGYTWEASLHLYLKRALGLSATWGGADLHRRKVISRMRALPIGPDRTFASTVAEAA